MCLEYCHNLPLGNLKTFVVCYYLSETPDHQEDENKGGKKYACLENVVPEKIMKSSRSIF